MIKDNIKKLLEDEFDKRRDIEFLISFFTEKVEEDKSSIIMKAYLYDLKQQLDETDITIQYLQDELRGV